MSRIKSKNKKKYNKKKFNSKKKNNRINNKSLEQNDLDLLAGTTFEGGKIKSIRIRKKHKFNSKKKQIAGTRPDVYIRRIKDWEGKVNKNKDIRKIHLTEQGIEWIPEEKMLTNFRQLFRSKKKTKTSEGRRVIKYEDIKWGSEGNLVKTTETGEKVGISKKDQKRMIFVFMRNFCCGKPYTCVAFPLCIRMCGFIISILSVFQVMVMEMCS